MTIGLGKGQLDAVFINGPLKVGMPSCEGCGHINFEVSRNSNFVAEAA
jgi:hypothetical protein